MIIEVNRALMRGLALACALALPLAPPAQAQQRGEGQLQSLDRIIAIVDDDVILASELRDAIERARTAIQRSGREMPPEEQFQRQIFDQLILESLQLQMARRAGVRISDAELNESLERIAAQNNMTLEQFSQALSQDGLSYPAAREQLRKEMLLQRVQQGNVNQRVQITDQEIDNFLNSAEGQALISPHYRLLHALIPVPEDATPDTEAKAQRYAEQLAARLRSGESFKSVIESNGPLPVEGGDLGWRQADDLPSLLAPIVPKLREGEVSDPFRSPSGYHLLQVVGVRGRGEVIQQTKVRHILLKASAIRTEEQTEQLAADLRQRALRGEDFSELARQYSEDIGSAMEGGELGWTNPGQLVDEFQKAMDNTDIGAISPPFRSRYGWHILQVEDRRQQDVTDELRRNVARNYLHQRKFQEELDAWLRKIRDEAYVDIKF